jgi:hypothetical protein
MPTHCLPFVLLLLQTLPASGPAGAFPDAWVGRWRGPCTYVPAKGEVKQFVMELNVARADDPARYTWEIVYEDAGQRQVRLYELVVVDAGAGRYVIDEHNSIRIDATFIDGALYSQFDVMSSRITASYRREGERIVVELMTADAKNPKQTGGQGQAPPVTTYAARGVQRGVLKRE